MSCQKLFRFCSTCAVSYMPDCANCTSSFKKQPKKNQRSFIRACTLTSRDKCAQFHPHTLYKVFVHIFYISFNIRILSINKLGIVQGLQLGK